MQTVQVVEVEPERRKSRAVDVPGVVEGSEPGEVVITLEVVDLDDLDGVPAAVVGGVDPVGAAVVGRGRGVLGRHAWLRRSARMCGTSEQNRSARSRP